MEPMDDLIFIEDECSWIDPETLRAALDAIDPKLATGVAVWGSSTPFLLDLLQWDGPITDTTHG